MSRVDIQTFTCPKCGWSVSTPFGEQDLTEHCNLHVQKHHSDKVTRARISKSELIKLQRK